MTVADPERLITDPKRSLLAGAMDGTKTGRFYGDPHGQYVAALEAAGAAAGIDFSKPYEDLSEAEREIALHGTGDRIYDIVWSYKRGNRAGDFKFRGRWKGFAALVAEEYERKHADHRGEAMRVLMKDEPCPGCGGKRLKPASLAVTYRGLDIAGPLRSHRGPSHRLLRRRDRSRAGRRPNRGRDGGRSRRDPAPPPAHPRRRTGLPQPRPRLGQPLGRRGPAAPAGRAPRRQAHRRHLRPGRADARAPSPRHGKAPRI